MSQGETLRVLAVFAEAPGSRPLAMRKEREELRALVHAAPPGGLLAQEPFAALRQFLDSRNVDRAALQAELDRLVAQAHEAATDADDHRESL